MTDPIRFYDTTAALVLLLERRVNIALPRLTAVARLVADAAGVAIQANRPIIGANAFRYESGIHLLKIQNAITGVCGIAEVAVVGVPSQRWGERPVAFATIDGAFDREALDAALLARLARFKWPDRIERVADLPRSGSDKVDLQELARRAAAGPGDILWSRGGDG